MLPGDRSAEIEALCLVAAVCLKKSYLVFRFHALSDHTFLETFGHGDDRADDCRIVCIGGDVAHEGSVNLQGIDRKLFQVAQTGIPGTEIIHRETHPNGFERPETEEVDSMRCMSTVSASSSSR